VIVSRRTVYAPGASHLMIILIIQFQPSQYHRMIFFPQNFSNYVSFHIFHCYYTMGIKSCKFDTLNVALELTQYSLRSFEFKVYMIVKEDIPYNATNLKLTYNKIGSDYYYIALFIIAWIMTLTLICAAAYSSIPLIKRCCVKIRRYRLLRQLRRSGGDEETTHLSLEVPVVMSWKNLLRNVKYSNKENEYEQCECCFCLEPFDEDETVAKLFCKHIFHPKCFESWITLPDQTQVKCPICARIVV